MATLVELQQQQQLHRSGVCVDVVVNGGGGGGGGNGVDLSRGRASFFSSNSARKTATTARAAVTIPPSAIAAGGGRTGGGGRGAGGRGGGRGGGCEGRGGETREPSPSLGNAPLFFSTASGVQEPTLSRASPPTIAITNATTATAAALAPPFPTTLPYGSTSHESALASAASTSANGGGGGGRVGGGGGGVGGGGGSSVGGLGLQQNPRVFTSVPTDGVNQQQKPQKQRPTQQELPRSLRSDQELLTSLAAKKATPLSLRDIHAFCQSTSMASRIVQARFLHREVSTENTRRKGNSWNTECTSQNRTQKVLVRTKKVLVITQKVRIITQSVLLFYYLLCRRVSCVERRAQRTSTESTSYHRTGTCYFLFIVQMRLLHREVNTEKKHRKYSM